LAVDFVSPYYSIGNWVFRDPANDAQPDWNNFDEAVHQCSAVRLRGGRGWRTDGAVYELHHG
jgi:hypothetical protein